MFDTVAVTVGILVPALAATALTRPVARWAATRATAQPTDTRPDDEAAVLAHLAAHPADYPVVSPLEPGDFTSPDAAAAWARVKAACAHLALPTGDEPDLDDLLTAAGQQVPDLADALTGVTPLPEPLTRTQLQKAGQAILDASSDRTEFHTGWLPQEPGRPGEPPLVRRYREPSRRRLAGTATLLAAGMAAAMTIALTGYATPVSITLAALAGLALTVGCTAWTLIDLDTLYVDLATVLPITVTAWALAAAAAVLAGDPARLLAGAGAAVFVIAILMIANGAYRLVRGRNGLGAGDKYLAPAAVGVPAAITGTWTLGYGALMAALLTATAAWLLLAVAAKTGRNTPMAFAPYLATGWITAIAAAAVTAPL